MTTKDYAAAIITLKSSPLELPSWEALRCMKNICYNGYSPSGGQDTNAVNDAMQDAYKFLIDMKENLSTILPDVLFPLMSDSAPKSFKSKVTAMLYDLKATPPLIKEYKDTLADSSDGLIPTFKGELQSISIDNFVNNSSAFSGNMQTLASWANNLSGYRQSCFLNQCGEFGGMSAAEGVMNSCSYYTQSVSNISAAVNLITTFCSQIKDNLNAIMDQLNAIYAMPTDTPDQRDQICTAINTLMSKWQTLVSMIDNS
jgi:hypothetical protein